MAQEQPVEDIRKRLSDIRVRLEALPKEIEASKQVQLEYDETRDSQTPWWVLWWRGLTGNRRDATSISYQERWWGLDDERSKLQQENSHLERAIKKATSAKRHFRESQLARKAGEARRQAEAENHDKFCASAINNLQGEFDRKNFHIQLEDYRRGNKIDNYFRYKIANTVLRAFNHCCVFCGTTDGLTFDHYAVSKNEGGNFALITADKASIHLNIVVLCRSCNSSKAQTGHMLYFNDVQRERAVSCQRTLLAHLLSDSRFLKLISKWKR